MGLLFMALGCFLCGVFLPFTSVTKLWLFENQVSVYHGLMVLWEAGEEFLFLILFVFTVCFPLVKMNALLAVWLWPSVNTSRSRQLFHFVSNLGKWSMLDVFIVAILVVTVKTGSLATIELGKGLFLFFLSVILTQFASLWTGKVVSHLKNPS